MGTKVEGNSKYAHRPLAAKAACALPASERCRAGSTASSSGVPWRKRTRARRSPIHARRTITPANDPFTKPKTEFHYPEFSSEKRSASMTELLSNRFKAFGKVAEIGIRGAHYRRERAPLSLLSACAAANAPRRAPVRIRSLGICRRK